MDTDACAGGARLDRPTASQSPSRTLRRGWGVVTAVLLAGVFIEVVLTDAMAKR